MTEELIAKIGQLIADLKSSHAVNVNAGNFPSRNSLVVFDVIPN